MVYLVLLSIHAQTVFVIHLIWQLYLPMFTIVQGETIPLGKMSLASKTRRSVHINPLDPGAAGGKTLRN